MAKLTERERESFEDILKKDLGSIQSKFVSQIKDFWGISRKEILRIRGWDKLLEEKEKLKQDEMRIKQRLHEIETKMNKEPLLAEQVIELGGKINEYDRYEGANFYGIPVTSQFEYDIVQYIKDRVTLEIPAKILKDIAESSLRELAMSGTFEEARSAYQKFYSLDFRKYGVDIPPRLDDVTRDKKMLELATASLNQVEQLEPPTGVEKEKRGIH